MRPQIVLARIGAAWRRGLTRAGQGLAALNQGGRRLARSTLTALRDAARRLVQAQCEGWRRLNVNRRQIIVALIVNLSLGLAIELALHHFHDLPPLRALDDLTLDWAMGLYRGTAAPAGARPIAFIDIDEASYRDWGEPLITPRDRLAALVRHAIAGGAAAIVLDIDLSRPGGPGDADLQSALAAYRPDAQGAAPDLPPLILVRTVPRTLPGPVASLPAERATPFDALVAQAPDIHWATSLFLQDPDGRVRHWERWTATCGTDGRPLVRPSIQLLLAALLDPDPRQHSALTAELAALVPADCTQTTATDQGHGAGHPAGQLEQPAGGHPDEHSDDHAGEHGAPGSSTLAARIRYRLPWHLNPGETRPSVVLDGRPLPELAVRRADTILAAPASTPGAAWLRGHLVIIGASHPDTPDLYLTPLGLMPGALIVANAVQSGHQGDLHPPNWYWTLTLGAALIITMTVLFTLFHSFLGGLLSGLAVLLILLPASLWYFGTGVWVSFAFPLIAIFLHRLFDDCREFFAKHLQGHHHD